LSALHQWCQGDVFVVEIVDPAGEHVDSCGGFYGFDYALEEAARMLDIDAVRLLEANPGLADLKVC